MSGIIDKVTNWLQRVDNWYVKQNKTAGKKTKSIMFKRMPGAVGCEAADSEAAACAPTTTPTIAWTQTSNDPANGTDIAYGIAMDNAGNVYVTTTLWVRKYDTNGKILWTQNHNGVSGYGIAVDSAGNAYITGKSIQVRKFDPNGKILWTRSSSSQDNGHGIAVDTIGDIYVTGSTGIVGQSSDILVRKCDVNGQTLWTRTHNGSANDSDSGNGITVDNAKNVYVIGNETVSGQESNTWMRKYDTNGNTIWTQTHNGSANKKDVGIGIAIDNIGNAYVTGLETGIGKEQNIWFRKLDTNGKTLWTQTHSKGGGHGIAVDTAGNFYITGYEYISGPSANILIRKYDTNGNIIWTQIYDGPAKGEDVGLGITTDNAGNVFVCGYETVSGQKENAWVRKYIDCAP